MLGFAPISDVPISAIPHVFIISITPSDLSVSSVLTQPQIYLVPEVVPSSLISSTVLDTVVITEITTLYPTVLLSTTSILSTEIEEEFIVQGLMIMDLSVNIPSTTLSVQKPDIMLGVSQPSITVVGTVV